MKHQGTNTTEGFIPHSEVMFDGSVVFAPVKLKRREPCRGKGLLITETGGERLPVPEKVGSGYVFVLPGGMEMIR